MLKPIFDEDVDFFSKKIILCAKGGDFKKGALDSDFMFVNIEPYTGSVLLRFTKIPGVFQVFSRLILNFPGVKTIPILSIADRISYKYVCYLS